MAYVDDNLLPGERIVHRARLHRIIYTWPIVTALLAILLTGFGVWKGDAPELLWAGGALFVVAGIAALRSCIKSSTSEFAVTNRRVVIKTGVIRRHTLELLLQKVEGIGVDQSVLGRMLNIGTIVVIGTGGSREQFSNIADPLKFRHQVQAQTAGDVQPPAVSESPHAAGATFCSACGTESPPNASFCFRCGQRLANV